METKEDGDAPEHAVLHTVQVINNLSYGGGRITVAYRRVKQTSDASECSSAASAVLQIREKELKKKILPAQLGQMNAYTSTCAMPAFQAMFVQDPIFPFH
jgi:hypothetical protein